MSHADSYDYVIVGAGSAGCVFARPAERGSEYFGLLLEEEAGTAIP
jgi:choline dehydrogenase-like flavoprotein